MRRGTPQAELFGSLLRVIRGKRSMRDVASKAGEIAATVSKIEKGQRALKQDKILTWAKALDVNKDDLLLLWNLTQGYIPIGNRWVFYQNEQNLCARIQNEQNLCTRIQAVMSNLSPENTFPYEINVSNIKPLGPIVRRQPKTTTNKELETLITNLTGVERERVRGYIEAILETNASSSDKK